MSVHKSATINGHNISINDANDSKFHVVVNGLCVFETDKFAAADHLFTKLVSAIIIWRRTE